MKTTERYAAPFPKECRDCPMGPLGAYARGYQAGRHRARSTVLSLEFKSPTTAAVVRLVLYALVVGAAKLL